MLTIFFLIFLQAARGIVMQTGIYFAPKGENLDLISALFKIIWRKTEENLQASLNFHTGPFPTCQLEMF